MFSNQELGKIERRTTMTDNKDDKIWVRIHSEFHFSMDRKECEGDPFYHIGNPVPVLCILPISQFQIRTSSGMIPLY
jgi:hypothetical protein